MRFYPDIPTRRASTLVRDLLTVVALVLFAWIALAVHDAVDQLAVLGRGVNESGSSIQDGFETAAEAVDEAPLVGHVADLGHEGAEKTHKLADLLGLVTFLLPAAFLLLRMLPLRIVEIRRLNAAARVLEPGGSERERLLAMRAAFALPYGQLLRYTHDPLGDLEEGRHEPLVRAVLEDAGLRTSAR